LKKTIPILFGTLIAINSIHFFDLFNVNELLKVYYNGGIHIEYFGKNSLGEPAVKRLVGTMGNPNINAIMFGAFSIYFFPVNFNRKALVYFLVSLLFLFLCQSRTSILFLVAMFLFLLVFYAKIWTKKQWMIVLSGILIAYLIAWMFATSFFQFTAYNNSLLDGSALFSGSARGRLETWNLLFTQILEYPIFGYGPNKEYFYANHIYAENEYILMFWRYGIIGLFFYMSLYLFPFWQLVKKANKSLIPVLLLLILMSVSALTNNPFTERNIELLFCVGLAWGYQLYHSNQQKYESK
jgi:O-antigen ligase